MNTISSKKMFIRIWRGSLYGETDLRTSKKSVLEKMFTGYMEMFTIYQSIHYIWRVYCIQV